MTLGDAIKHLEETLTDPAHEWRCESCKEEHRQLLMWLLELKSKRAQQKAEYNAPLTLDELRGMDGEPVWCVAPLYEKAEWAILHIVELSGEWFISVSGASRGYGDKDTYGKIWLAYRRKPKEGAK